MEKVRAPEGMLRAVANIWEVSSHAVEMSRATPILESALMWLASEIEKLFRYPQTLPWQAGYNTALEDVLKLFKAPKEDDPLVMYIMRHFDDVIADEASLRNRALVSVADYKEHVKRNGPKVENFDICQDEFQKGLKRTNLLPPRFHSGQASTYRLRVMTSQFWGLLNLKCRRESRIIWHGATFISVTIRSCLNSRM